MRCDVNTSRRRDQASNGPFGAPTLKVAFGLERLRQVDAAYQLSNMSKQRLLVFPSHYLRV